MGVPSSLNQSAARNRAADLREALAAGVLCADGAMGTQLASHSNLAQRIPRRAGVGPLCAGPEVCLDELNLSLPALVRDVHQAYLRAGAQILGTNTFGANRARLQRFGFAGEARAINRAGVRIAREAARGASPQGEAFVAGVIGPLGVTLAPLGSTSIEEARAIFREQAAALEESGVDLLILETFQDLEELREAAAAAREAAGPELAIAAQVSVDGSERICGVSPAEFVHEIEGLVDVIGVNCSAGPAGVLDALEKIARYTAKPLSAAPNAGLPRRVSGGFEYPCSPEYMAGYARRFVAAGARIVGGCCGSTPEHIRAMRGAIENVETPVRTVASVEAPAEPQAATAPVPMPDRSGLGGALSAGRFVTAIEILPPSEADASAELAAARWARDHGTGAFVPDSRRSRRMPGAALCGEIGQEAELECILAAARFDAESPQEILALQGYLLGAHAQGVCNLVFAGGGAGVVAAASRLNRGLSVTGHPAGSQTAFVVGVMVNPAASDMEAELQRLEKNIQAGADFALTEPLFDVAGLETFVQQLQERREGRPFPVIVNVRVLSGEREADVIRNELAIPVPPELAERLGAAGTEESARLEGIGIAQEIVERVRGIAAGVVLSGPIESCQAALNSAEGATLA